MKKIGNWLKNHFIISCIVSGFIGAIIAWGLNWILISPPVKVGNLPQKELTCTLNYSQKLITKNTKDDGFKIMYHDKEVMDPYIFSITISNTGDYAIENEDFKKEFLWGYSINFLLSALNKCTPSYVNYFVNKCHIKAEELPNLLVMLEDDKKVAFDEKHGKEIYEQYLNLKGETDD